MYLCILLFPLILLPQTDAFCAKLNRNRCISSVVSNHRLSSTITTASTTNSNGCPITAMKNKFASIKSFMSEKKIKTISLVFVVLLGSILLPGKFHKVNAAIMNNIKIKGWDLYGRIPHDDWIFNMWTLTDPNLLKRSFVEVIVHELPDVIINMKERRRFNELVTILSGFGYFAVAVMIVTVLYRSAIQTYQRRVEREDSIRGYKLPTSAVSKKAKKKGKQLDGMDEGWVDMELNADDDNENNNKNDDDDDDDDDDIDNRKKNRK
jgi:hypothetical protein